MTLLITVSPDIFFNFQYGILPGKRRETIILPSEFVFPKDVFLFVGGDESYTRIVEYKVFRYKSIHFDLYCDALPMEDIILTNKERDGLALKYQTGP